MKNKKILLSIAGGVVVVVVAVLLFILIGKKDNVQVSQPSELFYQNELTTVGADPDALYITEGEDAGYYYMYITSDELGGAGFFGYKSKDLVNWECAGVALNPEGYYNEATGYTTISYAFSSYWAPEVIYDKETKLYYMFYTANRYDTSFESSLNFYGDIAVSESPAGPFVQYNKYLGKEPVVIDEAKKLLAYEPVFDFAKMPVDHPLYESATNGYMKIIDLNPFVDPKTGKKYMYFCHDLGKALAVSESNIYVVELNDDYTANYESVCRLTSPNQYTLDSKVSQEMNEGSVNEAPYMIYNEESGLYYLLYSANSYYQKTYSVRVAVGKAPTGPFTKLSQDEGGFLLYAESHWSWASGTGHCSVVNKNGQDYIVYHAHLDRVNGNSTRGIAIDELKWVKNDAGMLVPVVNGPSYSYMPLTTNQYENVAPKAEIQVDGGAADVTYLNDTLIGHHEISFIKETVFDGNAATVTLDLKNAEAVSGLAIYNSRDYDYMFSSIKSVKLILENGKKVAYKNLEFDWEQYYTEDGYVVPGGVIALEFEKKNVKSIEIRMPAMDTEYAISEIVVMAKKGDAEKVEDDKEASWQIEVPEDDTVSFDGKIAADEYTGEQIAFSDTNGVTLTMYSKMAEDGIFFGFHSNDTNVYVNPEHAIHQNTSVEIQLAKGGTDKLNANVIQVRYGLDGTAEGWIGVKSAKNYEYIRSYIDTVSKIHIYGELNSSECEGYDVEAYIPYSAMNLEGKPDSLICAPSFNTRKDYEASGRTTWTLMVGSSFTDPTSWYRIESEGQTVMTDGFKVQYNKITQSGSSNQFYYFGDELSDAYYVNVDVKIGDVLNNDRYPKFGIVSKSLDSMLAYYFDFAGGTYNAIGRVGARTTEFSGTSWEWETNSSRTFGIDRNMGLSRHQSVNIELIRYEDTFVLLVNGQYVMGDIDVKGLEKSSIPGLFFFNTEAEITVNAYETDKDNVENYICDYLPEVELDADLSDWDLKKTLLKSETDASNGNKMNVYAYKNDSGVYLAYDVKHQYQPKVYMWNEGADERGVWYYNTNGEFWINDMHFACTTFGDSGYMMKAMKTTEDLKTGGYTTVIEAFIPNEVIQSNTAAIGFSFKTCDMSYGNANEITNNAMKFNGDPWWFFKGQFPTDMSSRFILE
ncbi:MAG: family 43 glycosylhydrolase [Alphaproteobacteria bacterium]|nr:family 43 glycosylhydrolase [Alphaproteobacteria bacterium]